jgi:hypothetical protein
MLMNEDIALYGRPGNRDGIMIVSRLKILVMMEIATEILFK